MNQNFTGLAINRHVLTFESSKNLAINYNNLFINVRGFRIDPGT